MNRPRVLIISPAEAGANNGNWQTAWRWSRLLRHAFKPTIAQRWDGAPFDVMLALHARRSADTITRWAQTHGSRSEAPGLGVVLTGTDLYRDIHSDASAQASLVLAKRLVLLQACGPNALPHALRPKARVIFQSVSSRPSHTKTQRHLRVVMVGHLRDEKSPQTLFATARLLQGEPNILIDHIGAALDPELGAQALACADECPNYRWLGGLSHEVTRRHIQRAHLLVHTSRMEGGAHVLMEAVCSGTPVLASRIDGNVGMLGQDYTGYFTHGDAAALVNLLRHCRDAQMQHAATLTIHQPPKVDFFNQLQAQCTQRAPLFAPATEQAALIALVRELLP
ncbi:MAG: putative glycosyltransferase (TIGR04348 family) [Rhodoferax sp.]|jgi:putative glycosyltransferase (TIGR04348 family)